MLPILFTAVESPLDIVVAEGGTIIELDSARIVLGENLESGGGILRYDDLVRRNLELAYPAACPTDELWAVSSILSE